VTENAADRRAPVPGLGGTGYLADDLYLMSHHERSGRLLLSARAAGLGLAGALLAELVLAGCVRVADGQLDATGLAQPDDELAARVLSVLASEQPPRPVADWLAFLARTAPADVAGRLERAGYLVAAPALPWRPARWRPADPDCAFAPVTRVKSALSPGRPADAQDRALAGLAAACGLGARLATYLPPGSRARMEQAAAQLDPGLRELITQTQATVGAALLAHRI
jgi:Golgi phosphoprotein 3 (GPP34)